jgi:hypothetical protein
MAWAVATNVSATVRKLLSAVKTHLIRPARKREGTTEVAVPATKEELNFLKQLFPLVSRATAFRTFSTIPGLPTIPNPEIIVATTGRDLNVKALLPQKHEGGINRNPGEP